MTVNEIPAEPAGRIDIFPELGSDVAAVAALDGQLLPHGGRAMSWDFGEGGTADLQVHYPESDSEARLCREIVALWAADHVQH
jgi:hypothetical protein